MQFRFSFFNSIGLILLINCLNFSWTYLFKLSWMDGIIFTMLKQIWIILVICCYCLPVIDLPSPHHKWYATNSSVVRMDSMLGVAHALNFGVTDIVVEDTRLSGHLQTSTMHVVRPDKLCLYLIPVTNGSIPIESIIPLSSSDVWYVFPGQEYMINVKVFSKGPDANEILVTEVWISIFLSYEVCNFS